MFDPLEVRDCALLASAAYQSSDNAVKVFLSKKGHRFSGGTTCSNLSDHNGHFLIAEVTTDPTITTYVAIRGSFSLADWGANFKAWPTIKAMGMVHAGWYSRMQQLPQNLLIERLKDGHRVVICGHSLGGAVAQILAVDILQSFAGDFNAAEYRSRVQCISFAGPMVMSGLGADTVNLHFKDNFVNFVHSQDIVPKVLSFAQVALKQLCASDRRTEANNLVNMLRTAVKQNAYVETTARAGMVALLSSDAVRVALTYKPIGHYFRVDTPSGTALEPLTAGELDTLLAWKNVELSHDVVQAHDMSTVYVNGVLSKLVANAACCVKEEPVTLLLPKPEIHRIVLQRSGAEVLVSVFGTHLYMIKHIKSSMMPLCALNHQITSEAMVTQGKLTFTVPALKDRIEHSAAASATTGAVLVVSLGLCWNDAIQYKRIPVEIANIRPLDMCSLQEMISAAFYLLMFVSREDGHHNHPKLLELRMLLKMILETVPAEVFFAFGSPVTEHCLNDNADYIISILCSSVRGRRVLDDYIATARGMHDNCTDPEREKVLAKQIDVLRRRCKDHNAHEPAFPNLSQSILSVLAPLSSIGVADTLESDRGLQVMMQALEGPLTIARAALKEDLTVENYQRFLGALATGLAATSVLVLPLGKYYDFKQSELGLIDKALKAFLYYPIVRNAVQSFSLGLILVGSLAGFMFLGNLVMLMAVTGAVFYPSLLITYYGAMLGGILLRGASTEFPTAILNSSAALRKAVCEHRGISVPEGAVQGEIESVLAADLNTREGVSKDSDLRLLKNIILHCFPYVNKNNSHLGDVTRRMKLMILSNSLRDVLKKLPIVLLTGPTRSGKSTFREHIQNGAPNRAYFGSRTAHRTSVPEMFFCGTPEQPIGVLDSIGIGDPTRDSVVGAIEEANKLFRLFCQATIMVINEAEVSPMVRGMMYRTSTVPMPPIYNEAGKLIPTTDDDRATVQHPTMTAFTNADKIASGIGGFFPENEGGPNELRQEAAARVTRGLPFDLRSVETDAFTPRVFANFESRIVVPEEYRGTVYTTEDVRAWLLSHFYPADAVAAADAIPPPLPLPVGAPDVDIAPPPPGPLDA